MQEQSLTNARNDCAAEVAAVAPARGGFAFGALLLVLAWAPLPLGSNRVWAWSVLEASAFGVLAVWLVGYLRRPYALPDAVQAARVPLLLFAGWLAYGVVQVVPLPAAVVQVLSPATYELYGYALGGADMPLLSLSVDRGATLVELLKDGAYVVLFFLVLVLVHNRRRLHLLATVLLFVGLAEASFGLANKFAGGELGRWINAGVAGHFVSGTFVNRNHLAAHLGMTIPLGLGLLLAAMRPQTASSDWRLWLHRFSGGFLSAHYRVFMYLLVMFAALFLSTSRAGAGALFLALAIVVMLAALFKGRRVPDVRFAPLVLVLAVFAAMWFGAGDLGRRLVETDWSTDERVAQSHEGLKVAENHLLFGVGAGNYRSVFPLYRSTPLRPVLYDHAHNDYLELVCDQGIIGAALLGGAVILLLVKIVGAYRRRHDLLVRGMLFASLVGVVAMLLHALADFNFHIPANAAYFYVLLGIGMAASTLQHGSQNRARA